MSSETKHLGTIFTWIGWLLGIAILVLVFNKLLAPKANLISSINHSGNSPFNEIILQRSRNGHYVFNALVNNKKITFLVDTGATITSIPMNLAEQLNLKVGRPFNVETANGRTKAYATKIDHLKLGAIELNNVAASLISGINGNEALLGMNVLKHFELIQRNKQLIIRQYL